MKKVSLEKIRNSCDYPVIYIKAYDPVLDSFICCSKCNNFLFILDPHYIVGKCTNPQCQCPMAILTKDLLTPYQKVVRV